MNVGFLCESIVNRTLAFQLGFILGKKITHVFLPTENHSHDELFPVQDATFHICDHPHEILSSCSMLFCNKNSLRNFKISHNRIVISNPWINESNKNTMNNIKELFPSVNKNSKKPLIVILSLGKFTDQFYAEITIRKILLEFGATVFQLFSEETFNLLSQLSKQGVLSPLLLKNDKKTADVAVVSINGTKFHNDAEFLHMITRLCPDLLFACVDRRFNSFAAFDRLVSIFTNRCLFIRSPYIAYDVGTGIKFPVYGEIKKDEKNCIASLNPNFEESLKKKLFDSLYFPPKISFL